jgi:hypothetical protein
MRRLAHHRRRYDSIYSERQLTMRMTIVPTILCRQNSVNDQHQQREEHEVNQFGFICHKTPPLKRNLAELYICAIPWVTVSLNGCINTGKFYAEILTIEKHIGVRWRSAFGGGTAWRAP